MLVRLLHASFQRVTSSMSRNAPASSCPSLHVPLMLIPSVKSRITIGRCAFALALVCIAWLPLGILEVVPFVLKWPGESSLRLHAGAAVGSLLVAAWGFWEWS